MPAISLSLKKTRYVQYVLTTERNPGLLILLQWAPGRPLSEAPKAGDLIGPFRRPVSVIESKPRHLEECGEVMSVACFVVSARTVFWVRAGSGSLQA